ncbi:MAG TPA: Hsp70 family protein [Stackebrandtia sp.]|uniref:Hsp70 family protein n=1 Tax=Stackebrandtia sp. TaxID=2023065 RepID=UPI002D241698|nr:Hsp70 family protein [Stackebrandtia sp.]HZE41167.1 Hsp70 family protein [Stackebrandtia sp.]
MTPLPPHQPPTGYTPQQSPPTAPVSPPRTQATPAAGIPPNNGYLLGVDLGTSHTVAVIRWPDGRSRPLLVDGAPVMPSAVFCDESGHIHVGRDAQRLAQTDPSRFEPNPKHRIDENSILLGDREVPVTALLSAVLREVAAKAVESVGHLPPAVLTCPAKWGPQRRSILEDAAAQAGFPPVKLVPEPVAAAHYFAEVMRRPIPVGKSLGVFDFGGGTLDVAVVRHEPDGSFSLQADGGLEDLGGLDVDAALVEYMGRTISGTVPEVWRRLTEPHTGTDRRNRRLFWDDVRGAKEMLSRTTVAPVPVPGVESSLHMTREELERLAGPLLTRAVTETQRVIAATGQSPDQMAGLFLVGGASRIPMVSRLLHSQLGIAPTVLEQPELPVAEGSLPAAFGNDGNQPVSPVAEQPVSPVTGPYTPPPPGHTPPGGFLEPAAPAKPWYKRKASWIAAAVVLLLLVAGGWWLFHDPYPQRDMQPLAQVGKDVAIPDEGTGGVPDIDRGVAYFPSTGSDTNNLTAINVDTGKKKWNTELSSDWTETHVYATNGLVYATNASSDDPQQVAFINPSSGHIYKTMDLSSGDDYSDPADWVFLVNDRLIRVANDTVYGYDAQGHQKWKKSAPGGTVDNGGAMDDWDSNQSPVNSGEAEYDGRIWIHTLGGKAAILDSADGKQLASKQVGGDADNKNVYLAYDGVFYATSGSSGYSLTAYDMDDGLKQTTSWKPEGAKLNPYSIWVCGEESLCVHEDSDGDSEPDHGTVIDIGQKSSTDWATPKGWKVSSMDVAGETIEVQYSTSGTTHTQLFEADGTKIGGAHKGSFTRIDSGSFLTMPSNDASTTSVTEFTGLGARDGRTYTLGGQQTSSSCAATDSRLACVVDTGYRVWKFRD